VWLSCRYDRAKGSDPLTLKLVRLLPPRTRTTFIGLAIRLKLAQRVYTSPVPDAFTYVHPFLFSSSLGSSLTSW
jgi:hypothetical protein